MVRYWGSHSAHEENEKGRYSIGDTILMLKGRLGSGLQPKHQIHESRSRPTTPAKRKRISVLEVSRFRIRWRFTIKPFVSEFLGFRGKQGLVLLINYLVYRLTCSGDVVCVENGPAAALLVGTDRFRYAPSSALPAA